MTMRDAVLVAIGVGAMIAYVLSQSRPGARNTPGVDIVSYGQPGVTGVDAVLAIAESAGAEYGVPRGMMSRLVLRESGGDPSALGDAGRSRGLCQIQIETWGDLVRWGLVSGGADPWDPVANCRGGAAYLARLKGQLGGWRAAAAGYNWGPANVASGAPWPASVTSYVDQVAGAI